MKVKKRDPRLFDQVSCRILTKKYKRLQRKVDQWLVLPAILCSKFHLFAKISSTKSWPKRRWKFACFRKKRHRKLHLYAQLSYTKISYLRKDTHLRKDAAFLHFHLKESSENTVFPWNGNIRKLTKKWSFLSFSQTFVRQKFFFSCSGQYNRKD